MQLM
jgi:hypothetical protein